MKFAEKGDDQKLWISSFFLSAPIYLLVKRIDSIEYVLYLSINRYTMSKTSEITFVAPSKVKLHPSNPRLIKDTKFKQLVKSIKDFPEMLEKRPLVVNNDFVVLGGNMRLKAAIEAGLKLVPVIIADWTEEQQNEFIIKDNVAFGEWDWDIIANEWESDSLNEWGLDVWKDETPVDYSILDAEDGDLIDDDIKEFSDGVRKSIMIEFELEHYEEAYELVKYWREQGLYVGKFLIDKLKAEKTK